MIHPNLRHLEIFLTLCATRSVTQTADRLNITQPAVSKAISALEQMLQIRLFDRQRNRLHLTANGAHLRDEAERLLNQVGFFGAEVEALQKARRGTVSVLAIPSLAAGAVARAVGDFSVSHPGIHVRLSMAMSRQIVEMVAQNRVNIGLVHGASGRNDLEESFVTDTHLHCLMASDHPLADLREVSVHDLAPYPLISFDVEAPPSAQIRDAFAREGRRPNIRTELNAGLLAPQIIRDDTIAFVDPLSVVPGPDLAMRPFFPRIALSIYMLTSRGVTSSIPMAAFCETLRHVVFRNVSEMGPGRAMR